MGGVDVVQLLLNVVGIQVNLVDDDGVSALMLACAEGHLEVVRTLLNVEEIQIDKTNHEGLTALDVAKIEREDKSYPKEIIRLLQCVGIHDFT